MKNHAILVAEDDENDFFLLERAIKKASLSMPVRRVKNGEEAVYYISGISTYSDRTAYPVPLLLLLDLKMPVKHGFDVLRWRKENKQAASLPVIIFSSSNRPDDVRLAYELGANAFLTKPASMEAMVESIQAIEAFWIRKNCFDFPVPLTPLE